MTTTFQAGGRSTATLVTLRLGGLVSFQVDLWSVRRSGSATDGAMKLACTHDHPIGMDGDDVIVGPSTVSQRYLCDSDPTHGPFQIHELGRGRHVSDTQFVTASRDEIIAAKTGGLEKELMELAVHPAGEVEAVCWQGEKGYLLRPSKGKAKKVSATAEESYATLRHLVVELATREENPLVLVGSLRLGDSRSTYKLSTWGDQLTLVQLELPSDLKERDVIDAEPSAKAVATLSTLIESSVEPFDEAIHRWDVEAAIEALVDGKAAEAPVAAEKKVIELSIDELVAAALG